MRSPTFLAALSGTAALTAGTALAGGLDEPVQEPVIQQPAPVVAPIDWTGGYVGLQFGALNSNLDNDVGIFDDEYSFGTNTEGGQVGIYGGYNWQTGGPWVYGVEGEYNWVDADDDATVTVRNLAGDNIDGTAEAQIDATGAIRGRVGYAVDRALFYAAAGAAYVDYEVSADVGGRSDTDSADNWGWTAGVGVEYAFSDNWSGRIDYRYSEFDGDDGSFYEGSSDGDYDLDLDTSELRVGVAYRF